MKRIIALSIAACLFSSSAYANMNIVVLDTVRAILETEEAKVLIKAAEAELEPENQDLQKLAEELKALQEKFNKDRDVLSATEQADMAKQSEDLRIDIQFGQQKLQKAVQDKRQEIIRALAPKFEKVRNDLIDVEGYDMILAPNALLYVNPRNDITRKVTERMNEQKD